MQAQANWKIERSDGKEERVQAGHVSLQTDGSIIFGNLVNQAFDAHTIYNARSWNKATRSSIETSNGLTQ